MATAILLKPTTPPDYHRIVSPNLVIPSEKTVPIPVGLLACDPLQRTLDSFVISSVLSNSNAGNKKPTGKKAVLAPTLPNAPILELVLHDTVIFPEGGGQPTDTGKITIKGDDKVWKVLQAKRHGGHAVHYLEVPADVSDALQIFLPGTAVTVTLDDEDYNRRYDHMSMHTSQHLLSALLETRLDMPTLSWSLTSYPSPCYVEIPRGMSGEEIISIQNEANRLVFEGRRVHIEVDVLEPEQNSHPTFEDAAGNSRAVGKALPEDYTGGVKRVVVIDGVDRNPCCGTHLPSINNLQLFILPHTEALSRSSTTSVRLYFLSGPRLIDHLTKSHILVTQSASLLSCGAPLVPDRLGQVIDDRKKAEKRVGDLELEIAERIAGDLVNKLKEESNGVTTFHLHRTEDTTNALGFLSSITSAVTSIIAAEKLELRPFLFILSSTPSSQTATSLSTVLVTGSDNALVKNCGDLLKMKLGIKGGGKGTRWSGKYIGVWKEVKEGQVVKEILESVNNKDM